jgi:Uma2 family endonuclease
MALTVGDREVRPLTADEVMRMVELGVLSEDEPSELLHGVLVARAVKSPEHEAVKNRLIQWLAEQARAGGYTVRVEGPIVVPDRTSLPEPDLSVVSAGGPPREHPTAALLAIEVSVSSLKTDTEVKSRLYAGAGIPEFWVVEPEAHRVRVYSEPRDEEYAAMITVAPPGVLVPQAVAVGPLDLAALFADL